MIRFRYIIQLEKGREPLIQNLLCSVTLRSDKLIFKLIKSRFCCTVEKFHSVTDENELQYLAESLGDVFFDEKLHVLHQLV